MNAELVSKKQTRYLSKLSDIKPCPYCGNEMPVFYRGFIAYLGCDRCGVIIGGARVIYKRDELPEDLKGLEYEADALTIIDDGQKIPYPEHNRVGINCVIALDHKGLLSKWNNLWDINIQERP
jgi:hypothetical protein